MNVQQYFRVPKQNLADAPAFISTWRTTSTSAGSSASNQIKLPLVLFGTYDFIVDWGDSNSDHITVWNQSEVTHTYAATGDYTVTITGTLRGWSFVNTGDRLKIRDISQWGALQPTTDSAFFNCSNLNVTATDTIDLSQTFTLRRFFRGCSSLIYNTSIASWDVSNIVNFEEFLSGCVLFNQNVNAWNTSSGQIFSSCFANCSTFNQPLNNWDLTSATAINGMLNICSAFNQNIESWSFPLVTSLNGILNLAGSFNQPLNGWDVSNITNFQQALASTPFNQPLNGWDVSSAVNMIGLFRGSAFNQDISSWDVSNVTAFSTTNIGMFQSSPFNQDISSWDVSSAVNMREMFRGNASFNQNISSWDISNVTELSRFIEGGGFSTANYDAILIAWAALPPSSGLTANFGSSKYTNSGAALAARNTLTGTYGWTIIDGGPA